MILDRLENIKKYRGISDYLDIAVKYISQGISGDLKEGKYEIDGENVFAVCAVYPTKDIADCNFEAHEQYIDIQIILEGKEMFRTALLNPTEDQSDYDADKDVKFPQCEYMTEFMLKPGIFCILFPWDAHMPGIEASKGSKNVRKVVLKVHV